MPSPFLLFAVLLLQSSNPSPTPGILLILSTIGAIVDWRYLKKGGRRASKQDLTMFLVALALVFILFVVLAVLGASAHSIGYALGFFFILMFAVWELARWRTRRKYPLEKTPVNPPKEKQT